MNCNKIGIDDLSALVDHRLGDQERLAVERHIAECAVCMREMKALQKTRRLVGMLQDLKAPDGFLQDIKNKIADLQHPRGFYTWIRAIMVSPGLKVSAAVAAAVVALFFPFYHQKLSAEAQLRAFQIEVDGNAWDRPDQFYTEFLAGQFHLTQAEIGELRKGGAGWGELTLVLLFGQELARTHGHSYPTLTDAIRRTGELRHEGKGWGAIAGNLDIEIRPVLLEVRHARAMLRSGELPRLREIKAPEETDRERSFVPSESPEPAAIPQEVPVEPATVQPPELRESGVSAQNDIGNNDGTDVRDTGREARSSVSEIKDSKREAKAASRNAKASRRETTSGVSGDARALKREAGDSIKTSRRDTAREAKAAAKSAQTAKGHSKEKRR